STSARARAASAPARRSSARKAASSRGSPLRPLPRRSCPSAPRARRYEHSPMIIVQHVASSSLAGKRQEFTTGPVRIGRRSECEVRFDAQQDLSVSGLHAELREEGGRLLVRDLGSTNGTFKNGARVEGEVELSPSDLVRLGANGPEMRGSCEASAVPSTLPVPSKQAGGTQTLHRMMRLERSKSMRALVVSVGLVALLGGAVAVWQMQRQES